MNSFVAADFLCYSHLTPLHGEEKPATQEGYVRFACDILSGAFMPRRGTPAPGIIGKLLIFQKPIARQYLIQPQAGLAQRYAGRAGAHRSI